MDSIEFDDIPLALVRHIRLLDRGVSQETLQVALAFKAGKSMAKLAVEYHKPVCAIQEAIRVVMRGIK